MTRDKNSLWLGMQSSSEGSGSLKVRPGAAIWKQMFLEQCEAAAAATQLRTKSLKLTIRGCYKILGSSTLEYQYIDSTLLTLFHTHKK